MEIDPEGAEQKRMTKSEGSLIFKSRVGVESADNLQ